MSIFLYSLLAAFLGEYQPKWPRRHAKTRPVRRVLAEREEFDIVPDRGIPSPNGDPRQHAKTRPAGRVLAEREGFEPSVATRTTAVFETAPFNHSGTSPVMRAKLYLRFQHCYVILDNTLAKAVFLLISPSMPWLLFLRHALKIPF
jgi:hypothetical protein